jgi:hypothetical protein
MRKLDLFMSLGVVFVFENSNMSFAIPSKGEAFEAMSSLIGNVDPQHVNFFISKAQDLIEKSQNALNACSEDEKESINYTVIYFTNLIRVVKKVLEYQQTPALQPQLQPELEAEAKSCGGGNLYKLIWPVIHPPAPPAPPG